METVRHQFRDLDAIVDRVHALFDQWERTALFPPSIPEPIRYMVRLAVHEWIANLVQHADFQDREPMIHIDLYPEEDRILCFIEDNSEGFDLDMNLRIRESMLERFPERGMGLLMIASCTEELTYTRLENGHFRLAFTVSADQDPWLNIPF